MTVLPLRETFPPALFTCTRWPQPIPLPDVGGTREVTFTAACPTCGDDTEWVHERVRGDATGDSTRLKEIRCPCTP